MCLGKKGENRPSPNRLFSRIIISYFLLLISISQDVSFFFQSDPSVGEHFRTV